MFLHSFTIKLFVHYHTCAPLSHSFLTKFLSSFSSNSACHLFFLKFGLDLFWSLKISSNGYFEIKSMYMSRITSLCASGVKVLGFFSKLISFEFPSVSAVYSISLSFLQNFLISNLSST